MMLSSRPLALVAAVLAVLATTGSPAPATSVDVVGAVDWTASVDEGNRIIDVHEVLGDTPGKVYKNITDISQAGVWTFVVTATNQSSALWSAFHFEIMNAGAAAPPPEVPSVPGDGVDFNNPQVGQGLPCASSQWGMICFGEWSIGSDVMSVDFLPHEVPAGGTITFVFDLTVACPPLDIPTNFTLAQHYTVVPEPASLLVVFCGLAAACRRGRHIGMP